MEPGASASLPVYGARVLALALAYYAAGRVGLLLAIPPGYATAVWPAAGIALAGILLWGKRVWPGIVLGSFCINLPTSLEALAGAWLLKPWLLAASISVAAALQAMLGALLVRRWVSRENLLAREVEIVKFLVLAGPTSCLLGATVSVACLWSSGVIADADVLFHWWTWWVGDTIGVLLCVPAVLTWTAPASLLSWRKKIYLSLPLTALCALVVLVFVYASGLEQRRVHADFARRTGQLTHVLSLNLAGYTEVLDAIGDLFASNPQPSERQFSAFVRRSLADRPGIQALSWNPIVADAERSQFEQAARAAAHPDYRISELDRSGRLQAAHPRPRYVPVRYIEPQRDNARAMGFDIASDPARRAALSRAGDAGRSTATGSITLVQDGKSYGFLLALPVYRPGPAPSTPEQRRQALRGYAVAAFQIKDLMASFLRGQDIEGIALSLSDDRAPPGEKLLFRQVPKDRGDGPDGAVRTTATSSSGFVEASRIEIGGRPLTLRYELSSGYLDNQRTWLAWSVLAVGLLFTALLGAFLLVAAGRTGVIEETVVRRTAQLRLANLELERIRTGLAENKQALEEAQKIAQVGSWQWEAATDTVTWSDEMYRIHGADVGSFEPSRHAYLQRAHPDDRAAIAAGLRRALDTREPFSFEHRVIRADGTTRMIQVHGKVLANADGEILRLLGTAQDVTEFKETEQRLLQLAHFDPLTALPNRTLFYRSLGEALAHAAEQSWSVSVLFLDIDNFKNVNDTLGHSCGDELLRQLGGRLVRALRVRDTIGRLGGDEFAIILVNPENTPDAATIVADKLRDALRQPFELDGREVTVTASIGITEFPADATDAQVLVKYADTAMYAAKEAGRDTYRYYTAAMNANVVRRLALDNALRRALDHDEFVLHYQPKMDIASGRWTGVEALLRWHRPGHGLVPPGEFIAQLEETGLIESVGNWVIDTACRQIAAWMAQGIGPVPIAVNVSGRQLQHGGAGGEGPRAFSAESIADESSTLERAIERALREHGVAAELLEIELTESTLMLHAARTVGLLQRLKERGIRIAIDDFGTGYSSLAYLKRFSATMIKIDRSFIRDIGSDADDAAITAAIIGMAHSLKLRVVAEGVETVEQLEFLRSHGCDEAQGYLLARPMAGEQCARLLLGKLATPG